MSDDRAITFDDVSHSQSPRVPVSASEAWPLRYPQMQFNPSCSKTQNKNATKTDPRSPCVPLPVQCTQQYRVRVLDAEKYAKTESLASGAKDFCDKVAQLNDIVKNVVEAVDQQVRGPHSARAERPAPLNPPPLPPPI